MWIFNPPVTSVHVLCALVQTARRAWCSALSSRSLGNVNTTENKRWTSEQCSWRCRQADRSIPVDHRHRPSSTVRLVTTLAMQWSSPYHHRADLRRKSHRDFRDTDTTITVAGPSTRPSVRLWVSNQRDCLVLFQLTKTRTEIGTKIDLN